MFNVIKLQFSFVLFSFFPILLLYAVVEGGRFIFLISCFRKRLLYILEILITPKVFLHQCKLGVGRWSVIEKMVNIVKERPPRCAIASRAASRLLRLVPLQSPAPRSGADGGGGGGAGRYY